MLESSFEDTKRRAFFFPGATHSTDMQSGYEVLLLDHIGVLGMHQRVVEVNFDGSLLRDEEISRFFRQAALSCHTDRHSIGSSPMQLLSLAKDYMIAHATRDEILEHYRLFMDVTFKIPEEEAPRPKSDGGAAWCDDDVPDYVRGRPYVQRRAKAIDEISLTLSSLEQFVNANLFYDCLTDSRILLAFFDEAAAAKKTKSCPTTLSMNAPLLWEKFNAILGIRVHSQMGFCLVTSTLDRGKIVDTQTRFLNTFSYFKMRDEPTPEMFYEVEKDLVNAIDLNVENKKAAKTKRLNLIVFTRGFGEPIVFDPITESASVPVPPVQERESAKPAPFAKKNSSVKKTQIIFGFNPIVVNGGLCVPKTNAANVPGRTMSVTVVLEEGMVYGRTWLYNLAEQTRASNLSNGEIPITTDETVLGIVDHVGNLEEPLPGDTKTLKTMFYMTPAPLEPDFEIGESFSLEFNPTRQFIVIAVERGFENTRGGKDHGAALQPDRLTALAVEMECAVAILELSVESKQQRNGLAALYGWDPSKSRRDRQIRTVFESFIPTVKLNKALFENESFGCSTRLRKMFRDSVLSMTRQHIQDVLNSFGLDTELEEEKVLRGSSVFGKSHATIERDEDILRAREQEVGRREMILVRQESELLQSQLSGLLKQLANRDAADENARAKKKARKAEKKLLKQSQGGC